MTYRTEHCHYSSLLGDPKRPHTLALFKVYRADEDALVAVVREPHEGLAGEKPDEYRVDCRVAPIDLRTYLATYFTPHRLAYFENPTWTWNDNGTYEEMPWSASP